MPPAAATVQKIIIIIYCMIGLVNESSITQQWNISISEYSN